MKLSYNQPRLSNPPTSHALGHLFGGRSNAGGGVFNVEARHGGTLRLPGGLWSAFDGEKLLVGKKRKKKRKKKKKKERERRRKRKKKKRERRGGEGG